MIIEAGSDMNVLGDSSAGPSLISRDLFLKYSFPFHCRLQKDLSQAGIKTVCHMCGNIDTILPDITAVGYPGLEIDYKTDIPRAAKIIDGKSVVFGPIDPSGVFYFGSTGDIRKETANILNIFKGKNLVIGSGCSLPKGTPEENLKTFVKTVHDYKV
jgi:uroporphyrinogen decarboxylase